MASGRTIEDVHREADRVTGESLDVTRQMLQMAQQTEDIGAHTLQELDSQGEKLRRIEGGLNDMNSDLRRAENELSALEKFCGCCGCGCFRKNVESSRSYKSTWKDTGVIDEEPGADDEDDGGAKGKGGGKKKGEFIQRVTNDAREDEMNENLGAIHDIIGNLKAQAMGMGEELDTQNKMIDRINAKAESNTDRLASANSRVTKLLK
eukprot:m.189787 g.189787  ORF g.189787 m.189787 type:complete len:207 (-) comp15435_c0_seq1:19-639(-)